MVGILTGIPIRSSASDQLIRGRGVTKPDKALVIHFLTHGNGLPSFDQRGTGTPQLEDPAVDHVVLLRPEIGPDASRCVYRLVQMIDGECVASTKS